MLDSAFQNAHYNRRNAKHSKMRCRQANLHLFGISFSLWKIFNLSSFRWYVDERERDLRRNQQIYIRRIPGGNNSFWQAWNTLRHVILLLRPSLCLSLFHSDGEEIGMEDWLFALCCVDGTSYSVWVEDNYYYSSGGLNKFRVSLSLTLFASLAYPRGVNGNRCEQSEMARANIMRSIQS